MTLVRARYLRLPIIAAVLLFSTASGNAQSSPKPISDQYGAIVLEDAPTAYWRFDNVTKDKIKNAAGGDANLAGALVGDVGLEIAGPRPAEFPLFDDQNYSLEIPGRSGYVRVEDPGESSSLDFDQGDGITIEAWVNLQSFNKGSYVYIVGKGRTHSPGYPADNQNYALRLKSNGGSGALSFLFRSRGQKGDWHRWTSKTGMPVGDGWHHLAVTYRFGDPKSIRGYIDGQATSGVWDMGGETKQPPVVDNDDLWIGSSMGGQLSSTFHGRIDEVALYRSELSSDRIAARFEYVPPKPDLDLARVPPNGVLVDIFEGIPDQKSWEFRRAKYVESYELPGFAFVDVPNKYSAKGIKVDRTSPFLIRAYGQVLIPKGDHRILIRCRNASRFYMDERKIAETKFHSISSSAHGRVSKIDESLAPNIRWLQRGDTEAIAKIKGDGQKHWFRFEMIVGGQKHRPEFGESGAFIAEPGHDFHLLSATLRIPLTDVAWPGFMADQLQYIQRLNAQRRKLSSTEEWEYWNQRHELARRIIGETPQAEIPNVSPHMPVNNDIDRFIGKQLDEAGVSPVGLTAELSFLRRVTLDAIGVVPTPDQIRAFLAEAPGKRRHAAIDRLLSDPRWADNWVGYWQDVLAENPNLVNPTLNNTGPFRWWIHESFEDNKPFDRFVTELIMMEGSEYFGGPAGFGMATQNDAPMAAKANIIGQAFLGVNMKCARCHDAPYHDLLQRDLFSVAAMLSRGPTQVPKTSTIPGGDDAVESLLVEVTLKPGEKVTPVWPFPEFASGKLPQQIVRDEKDEREQLALLITSPENQRFAPVIVNRLWQRYMGVGLVEPADDWENATTSHPDLLRFLAREFVSNGYDLKHIAGMIFRSHAYQRVAQDPQILREQGPYLFPGPIKRRMMAEQLVDSMFAICGKAFDSDPMCIDIDGARAYTQSLNLGQPKRAWQFTSLANERDRPSLALPFAQPFVNTLETFGWRGSRQDPITHREQESTVLQPAIMANGLLNQRVIRMSDDSRFKQMALKARSLEDLIRNVFLCVLCRQPTSDEFITFSDLLRDGFATRIVEDAPLQEKPRLRRNMVSWSNHLDPEANVIKVELQEAVRRGDPPTNRLVRDWRERMEDMLWSLTNSPEFVFLP